LSALIEQNRKGELASAVTVLSHIDNAGDDGTRTLNRRLARSAVISARLLQEGVLEHDKRVREQFRVCLLPLLGCVDASLYLSDVRASHSRKWLCEILISNLKEQALPETIGSAIILPYILSDSDNRCDYVSTFIASAPFSFLSVLFHVLADEDPEIQNELPQWTLKTILRILLKDDWWRLGSDGAGNALRLLAANRSVLPQVAMDCGVSPELRDILVLMTTFAEDSFQGEGNTVTRHGIIEVRYVRPSAIFEWRSWSEETWSALECSTGILQTTFRLFSLLRTPDEHSLNELIRSAGGTYLGLECLPFSLQGYLNRDIPVRIKKTISVDKLVERPWPGHVTMFGFKSKTEKDIDWNAIAKDDVWAFVYLLIQKNKEAVGALNNDNISSLFMKSLSDEPYILFEYINFWGDLFQLQGELGKSVRRLALESAKGAVLRQWFWPEIRPFLLRLPVEADFLPHLVALLVSSRRSGLLRGEELSGLVGKYTSAACTLSEIATSYRCVKRVQGAAAVLYNLHPDVIGTDQRLPANADFVDYYESAEGEWYLPSVAIALSDGVASNQIEKFDTMGRLLERANSDYMARLAASGLLREWRELARAPVQQHAVPEMWK
jgi:hypothetical protein